MILSAMLVQKRDLARQINLAQEHGCPVAVGGPSATSTPDAPELKQVDYLVLDEGEITVPMLVEAVQNGIRKGRFTASRQKPDLTTTPVPRFDLLDLDAYAMLAVQFSRGCPFQCELCDIIVLYGRKPRTKTASQLLAELEAIRRLNWRGEIFLVDGNFIGNKHNIKRLLPELASWQQNHGQPFSFTTEASLDLAADEELMELMTRSGFNRVFLGIETPDLSSLATANKHQNIRSPLLAAVEAITNQGLLVMAGFILGFDGEKAGAGKCIVEFVNQSKIPLAMVGSLQALPDMALWHRLERERRLLTVNSEFDAGVQTNLLNFLPTRPMDDIAAEFIEAFDQLYDPTNYLKRIYTYSIKLGSRQGRSQLSYKCFLAHLKRPKALIGLLSLLWNQGIARETRWIFWRYLLLTAIQRPQVLDQFLWMALLNEHFLEYRSVVRREVTNQLQWSRSQLLAGVTA